MKVRQVLRSVSRMPTIGLLFALEPLGMEVPLSRAKETFARIHEIAVL